ncbi:MAG: MBL fold metallo-hydrolase [Phycisphaera sp.]|nr:MBL fold metallo-hydrolase [Phycisphaera sp.]
MSIDLRIVSLGALSSHPLRGESGERRPGHATTTLLSTEDRRILIDPSLPPDHLRQRLDERTGLEPEAITDVFLTDLRPDRRRGISLFTDARWHVGENERETYRNVIETRRRELDDEDELDPETDRLLEIESQVVARCGAAPDRLLDGVDLFPLPGVTPGLCGLLIPLPRSTILICGDAVPTWEHLEQGSVLPHVSDLEQAQESFKEAIEIADQLVLGRDNMVANPTRRFGLS